MNRIETQNNITLLDGGMGRELMRIGAPFRQPEWSALSLIERPDLVKQVHQSFAEAGSEVLTTSNYAVVPFHIGEKKFFEQGPSLISLAGKLAREVASSYGCRVAGSIPPLFGSYRPDFFISDQASTLLKIIVESLDPYVDLWLAETVSSISEMQTVAEAVSASNHPLWVSYTLQDDGYSDEGTPFLRSGEKVINGIPLTLEMGASAILFNCSQPEVMSPAVAVTADEAKRINSKIKIGVYANSFSPMPKDALANTDLSKVRTDLQASDYLAFAENWHKLGATIIGGCCGIGPEHIAMLYEKLKCSV